MGTARVASRAQQKVGIAEALPNGWSWTAAMRGMALTTSSGVT